MRFSKSIKLIFTTLLFFISIGVIAQPRTPVKRDNGKTGAGDVGGSNPSGSTVGSWTVPIPTKDSIGPAKAQVNSFWKQIEKMRSHDKEDNKQVVFSSAIQSAQSALNNTKMKDPSYNTSNMEKALKECQDVYNSLASGKEDLRSSRLTTLKTLNMFFERGNRNLCTYDFNSQETDEEKIKRVRNNDDSLAKYKNMSIAYVSESKDELIYQDQLKKVIKIASGFQKPYDTKSKWPSGLGVMIHMEDPENTWSLGIFTFVQEVKYWEAYFFAAKTIYPNVPELGIAYEWCFKAKEQIGTTDVVLAKIGKSQADYLKKVKFPAPKVNDPALEAEFKKLFNEMGYKETIVKVSIQSTDWTIDRNELTGVIIGRSKQAFIATKTADGTCYVTEFWIFQDYNGNGYGSFRNVTANSYRSKIACENIDQ